MIFSNKKPKADKPGQNNPGYLSQMLTGYQRKAADYLNRKTSGWSPAKLKIVLILFCLITGNICLYTLGKAILSATGPPHQIKIQRLSVPTPLQPANKPQKIDSPLNIHH